MAQVFCSTTIHASANAVWKVISEFGAAEKYLYGVITCTVESSGIDALRTLTSADGSMNIERLETLDKATYQLSYALLTDTPFHNCLDRPEGTLYNHRDK